MDYDNEIGGLFAAPRPVRVNAAESSRKQGVDNDEQDFILCDISDFGHAEKPMSRVQVMHFILAGRSAGTIERIDRHDYRIGNRDCFMRGPKFESEVM